MARLSTLIFLLLLGATRPALALDLSDAERAWLAQHPKLRLGVDPAWAPFEYRDRDGQHQGYAADITALLSKRLGVEFILGPRQSWSKTLQQARSEQLDVLSAISSTPERRQYLQFTRPYLTLPIVILSRDDGPQPASIEQLRGLTVAVVRDYASHELLAREHPHLQLLASTSSEGAVLSLLLNQADAMVTDLASTTWVMRQHKADGLRITGTTPYQFRLAMATSINQPVLASILNKAIADLSPEELAPLQERWQSVPQTSWSNWHNLLGIALPALLILAIMLLFMRTLIGKNRLLQQETSHRQMLENQLSTSHQQLRNLVENLQAIAWEMDPQSLTFTYVSPHARRVLGIPVERWLNPNFWQQRLHPDDAANALAARQDALQAQQDHTLNYRLLNSAGHPVWFRDIATFSTNEAQPILRGLLLDISRERQAEQTLRHSEEKFVALFQQCPDLIAVIDRHTGRLLDVNQAFTLHLQIPTQEAIGKTPTELGLWPNRNVGLQLFWELQSRQMGHLETTFRRRDGSLFTGEICAKKIELDGVRALMITVRDISSQLQAREQLKASEEKFAKAFQALPEGLLISRRVDGLVLDINQAMCRISGLEHKDCLGKTTLELGLWNNGEDRGEVLQLLTENRLLPRIIDLQHRDGRLRRVEAVLTAIELNGEPCLLAAVRDVTEQERMQLQLRQAATVFESTAEAVMITDTLQGISAVNRAFCNISGYSEAEALGKTPRLLSSGRHDSAFFVAMWHSLAATGYWQGEIWNRRKNGEDFPCWLTINAVKGDDQRISHFVSVFADISSIKLAQARLDHQAHHDSLTGLPNRMLFENRLHAALQDAESQQGAVFFIDLDRFKHINDSLGHPVGDELLKGIAARLREQLRDVDTVARLGGDEFILLLPGIHQAADADRIARKLLDAFKTPVVACGHELHVSASIGISLYPRDGNDVATLVKNADSAMYRSKAKGRNRAEFYTREMTFLANERITLEHELRRALERGEMSLHYQPKISLLTQKLVGAEALIRWEHPLFGNIPPDRFIPLAEEIGLILPLGEWVLAEAVVQMRHWQDSHEAFGPLSVNLAGEQLKEDRVRSHIQQLLRGSALDPQRLQLEITESFLMHRTEEALQILHDLKAFGLQLAIDDFGTGYSSLSYLKRLPVDVLKIDKSFVKGLPDDPHDAAIARAIIALGRSMNLTVIAEGVETKAQEAFLAIEGCEQIQGFVVSRALTASDFSEHFLTPKAMHSAGQPASV